MLETIKSWLSFFWNSFVAKVTPFGGRPDFAKTPLRRLSNEDKYRFVYELISKQIESDGYA